MKDYSWSGSPFYNNSNIKTVVIEKGVTSIGDSAFSDCSSLTSVAIPDGVTSIDDWAFSYCFKLTSVIIPDSVTSIGSSAFEVCSSLTSVTIGDGVTSIGNSAFSGCSSLTGIWVDADNPNYSSDAYGVLFNKEKTKLIQAPGAITEYVIPDSVTSIGSSAFKDCSSLTGVTIGDSVTSIGSSAFYNCYSLQYNAYDNAKYLGNEKNPYVVLMETTSTSITTCEIHPDSKAIYDSAFSICSSLTSITIPDGVTSIGNYAFSYCSSLTTVIIPDSVTSIGNHAFSNCSSLTSVTIGDGVTNIDGSAFYGCSGLTGILADEDNPNYSNDAYGVLFNKEKTKLIKAPGAITEYVIPDSVTSIGDSAFYGCRSLTSITIPSSATSIDRNAFYGCQNLSDVYYIGTQQQWDTITVGSNNTYLTRATLHLVHIHSYDTCIITQEPTLSASGLLTKTCSCGESIVESIPQLVGKVKEWNMALGNDLAVNFYLEISDSIVSTAKVQLIQDDRTITAKISDLEKTADGLYKISVHMAATQMDDTIMVMVKNGSDKAPTADYSIRQYCDTLLADESQTAYHALIKEMLNYGAAAQAYFGYVSEGVANEGITGAGQAAVPEQVPEISVSGKAGSVRFYGASLVYESKIAVRFYFSGDVSGCSFTVGERTYTPVAKNGLYYIEVSDILPQNLDETIVVTISSGEDTLTIAYSPLTYIVRMNAKGSESLQNLIRALYNYHLAAKDIAEPSLKNGIQVVIYAPAYNKALSADKVSENSYYNKGVDVTYADGKLSGYTEAEIWTVTVNDDGSYSFANGGQNIGLAEEYSSLNLGAVNDKWSLESLGGTLYNIRNTARGNYLEWFASKSNWSTYASSSAATSDQFQMSIYVIDSGSLSSGETSEAPEPSEPETTEPEITEPETTEPEATDPTEPETTIPEETTEPTEPTTEDPSAVKYTFASYTAGTQYAENEVHKLDDVVTVITNNCYFTAQLRLYAQSSNTDTYTIIQSTKVIKSVDFTAGYRARTLNVYGSVDGETYTLIEAISVTAISYNSYSLDMPEGAEYRYLKLEALSAQIRIQDMTITFAE